MSRPFRARALVAVLMLFAAAGCQDYNFNPVGHCVLQAGTKKFTLSNVSSADVLFVVDDSGSMAGEQDRLAAAFTDFVENLTSTNRARAVGGLLPLDFHVAVTTTSIFRNTPPSGASPICRSGCTGATGLACCLGTVPVYGPRRCTTKSAIATAECPMSGTVCSDTCEGYEGELYCCNPGFPGHIPADAAGAAYGQPIGCHLEGAACGDLQTHYDYSDPQCTAATRGVSMNGFPYPDGAFVGSTSVSPVVANPRVLHFDKRLYYSGANAQGFTMPELKRLFEQNVHVGTCGSQEEQGLQASYDAISKALSGKQLDTYAYDWAAGITSGASSRIAQTFSAPGGMPTLVTPAVWPTPNSKLVVVYVGDEDDCSSPKDASAGVILSTSDACAVDAAFDDGTPGKKEYAVSSFVNYLTGLGRPVGAAFIVSATSKTGDQVTCSNDSCKPGICCDKPCFATEWASGNPKFATLCSSPDPNTCHMSDGSDACAYDVCGGQGGGKRFIDAASALKNKGADVVVGSICGDFRPLLRDVAEIVKPPQTLALPSVPAEAGIAMMRIADSSGGTRKMCGRPLAPQRPALTRLQAEATGADWWFVGTSDPAAPFDPTPLATGTSVVVPTKYVYINPKGSCIANPGETYSLDYLGLVPEGGCAAMPEDFAGPDGIVGTADDTSTAGGSQDCKNKMGGRFADWQCYVPDGLTTGTCQCRSGG